VTDPKREWDSNIFYAVRFRTRRAFARLRRRQAYEYTHSDEKHVG